MCSFYLCFLSYISVFEIFFFQFYICDFSIVILLSISFVHKPSLVTIELRKVQHSTISKSCPSIKKKAFSCIHYFRFFPDQCFITRFSCDWGNTVLHTMELCQYHAPLFSIVCGICGTNHRLFSPLVKDRRYASVCM